MLLVGFEFGTVGHSGCLIEPLGVNCETHIFVIIFLMFESNFTTEVKITVNSNLVARILLE